MADVKFSARPTKNLELTLEEVAERKATTTMEANVDYACVGDEQQLVVGYSSSPTVINNRARLHAYMCRHNTRVYTK